MQLVYIGSPENAFADAGLALDLGPQERVVFGRAATGRRLAFSRNRDELAIDIPLPWVSSRHCELMRIGKERRTTVIDLESRNGTRVDGRVIEGTHLVRVGDVLEVGRSFWMLREVDGEPGRVSRDEDVDLPHPLLPESAQLLSRAARSRVPVLVTGPVGGGKRRVAHWLHSRSGRTGELVTLDATTDSEPRLRSRLAHGRNGMPQALLDADQGTLCLHGIDALSLTMQEQVRALVADAARAEGLDVRLVATSTRDLRAAVGEGSFRRELYARLSACEVRVPALRERLDRLGVLIRDFYRGPDGPELHVTTEAFRYALAYSWPYNVRQLRQALTTAMTIASREGWVGQPVLAEALEQRLPGVVDASFGSDG